MVCVDRPKSVLWLANILAAVLFAAVIPAVHAQQLATRLILKDGSYQLAIKYEVKGERVRYLSAERGEWEELPKSMVDWEATEKYAQDRAKGVPPPGAIEFDKQLEAERQADEARTPQVAPGLRLPESSNILLLDTYQGQPQLAEIEQNGAEVNRNTKSNILRATINPIASSKQTIELDGLHAKVQAHATLPSIYVNVQPDQPAATNQATPPEPELPWDRFKIVRLTPKQGKRIAGAIKVAVFGKVSQEQNLVPTTAQQLTGGWVKVTPTEELAVGEYAVVEMLGKDGMNLSVWDFGVNPAAPVNMLVTKPDGPAAPLPPQQPVQLEKRPK